jgi:hypothetical protein
VNATEWQLLRCITFESRYRKMLARHHVGASEAGGVDAHTFTCTHTVRTHTPALICILRMLAVGPSTFSRFLAVICGLIRGEKYSATLRRHAWECSIRGRWKARTRKRWCADPCAAQPQTLQYCLVHGGGRDSSVLSLRLQCIPPPLSTFGCDKSELVDFPRLRAGACLKVKRALAPAATE